MQLRINFYYNGWGKLSIGLVITDPKNGTMLIIF